MKKTLAVLLLILISAASVPMNSFCGLANMKLVIAIHKDNMPRLSKNTSEAIADEISKTGAKTEFVTTAQIADPEQFNADKYDLIVFPNGALNPIAIKKNLWDYMRYGGKMILLGGPPFSDLCWREKGKWVDMESFIGQLSKRKDNKTIFGFDEESQGSDWVRETNNPGSPAEVKIVSPGTGKSKGCLQVKVASMTGWDQFTANVNPGAFEDSNMAICFQAKGDDKTRYLEVECREEDGSRWITMTMVSPEWQYRVLTPSDFMYWPDSAAKGRGFSGDKLNLTNLKKLSFGFSNDFTPIGPGSHTFAVDEVTALPMGEYADVSKQASVPALYEGLSPQYKLYSVSGVTGVKPGARQSIFSGYSWKIRNPLQCFVPIARPTGEGFVAARKSRWISLCEGQGQGDTEKGPVISMTIDWGKLRGAEWAYVAINDADFYKMPETIRFIKDLAVNMVSSPAILVAGSDKYTYFTGESAVLGAKIVNPVKRDVSAVVKITARKGSEAVYSIMKDVVLAPKEEFVYSESWKPEGKSAVYTVRTELIEDGKIIDAVEQEVNVVDDFQPISQKQKITVKGGKFFLGSKVWIPIGVNYWPSYSSGLELDDYYTHWLNPKFYDPVEVEKDLRVLEKTGANTVYIQYLAREQAPCVVDFLRRLENHGIKADIFLAHADPFNGDYNKNYFSDLISLARLADNPAVFSYDIAWEPNLNSIERRREYDKEWNKWIVEQYGSRENAAKEWKYTPTSINADGDWSAPVDGQLVKEGEWSKMVIAYRRFIDDLASRRYNEGCRDLRELDPNHLLGARTGYGGNGAAPPEWFAFDLFASAKHLDFISPEWYSLPKAEETRKAGFNVIYAKFVSNNKPVFWAEFGISVWDPIHSAASRELIVKQAELYDNFINMAWKAGSQGFAAWWFPGGFRLGEKSDYGIFDPDRTPRPAADSLRKGIALFRNEPGNMTPRNFIKIDRYRSSLGYFDVFNRAKDEYMELINSGKYPGIVTDGTGTTSENTPLVTICGTPYSGIGPLKYLNAEFNKVEISMDGKSWSEIKDGEEIPVNKSQSVWLRCSVGNISEAEWVSAPGKGRVFLSSTKNSAVKLEKPIPRNAKYLEDAEIPAFNLAGIVPGKRLVELTMTSKERAQFGQKFRFTLVSKP
ncbi:MAG: hypothetical protein ABII64_00790 [Elusimicrobiota bacterium]